MMYEPEKIKEKILNNEKEIIEFRRELHQHPELSLKEFETTKRIANKLDEYEISYRLTEPTGLIADIKGGKPGQTILLRADIDALPIQEANEIDYKSVNDGVMHACGHDTHAAMLVYAAKILNAMKSELTGNIRIVFQPAEEIGAGAVKMIEQGVLDGVDTVFGLHINSAWDINTVYCRKGEMMAASDNIQIKFIGREGHGARPHQGIDAIQMAASFLLNVQNVVTREINPLETVVMTFGKLVAGTSRGIVAGQAELDGSVRSFNKETQSQLEESIKRYAKEVAEMYRGDVEIEYNQSTPSVINDDSCAQRFYDLAIDLFGEGCIDNKDKVTGGEDFAFYMDGDKGVPGVFAFVGARSDDKQTHYNHHTNRFNIDESALKFGVYFHVMYSLKFLNGQ